MDMTGNEIVVKRSMVVHHFRLKCPGSLYDENHGSYVNLTS